MTASSLTFDDFAELTGFNTSTKTNTAAPYPQNKDADTSSLRWSDRPVLKLLLVVGAVGLATLVVSVFLGRLFGTEVPTDTPVTESIETTRVSPDEPDQGLFKARSAFGQQHKDLEMLSESTPVQEPPSEPEQPAAQTVSRSAPPAPTMVRSTPRQPITPARYSPPPVQTPVIPPTTSVQPAPLPTSVPVVNDSLASDVLTTALDTAAAPTEVASVEETELVEEPEETTTTLMPGSQALASTTSAITLMPGVPLRIPVTLNQSLPALDGSPAFPSGTPLLVELQTAGNDDAIPYLGVSSVILNAEEHPVPPGAMLALNNQAAIVAEAGTEGDSIDLESILVTGALSALDLGDNDLLTGLGLDLLRQVVDTPQSAPEPTTLTPITLPAGTEVLIHVNEAVTLPLPQEIGEEEDQLTSLLTGIDTPVSSALEASDISEEHRQPVAISPPMETTVLTVKPGHGATVSFLDSDETILQAWLDNPTMLDLAFDMPLESGTAGVVHLTLLADSTADSTLFSVVTQNGEGERRLYLYEIRRTPHESGESSFTLSLIDTDIV